MFAINRINKIAHKFTVMRDDLQEAINELYDKNIVLSKQVAENNKSIVQASNIVDGLDKILGDK